MRSRFAPALRLAACTAWAFAAAACAESGDAVRTLTPTDGTTVEVPRWTVEHRRLIIDQLVATDAGDKGWAVARDGRVFRLSGDGWSPDSALQAVAGGGIRSIHLAGDGRSGWMFTEHGTLKYDGRGWVRVEAQGRPAEVWGVPPRLEGWAAETRRYRPSLGRWAPAGEQIYLLDVAFTDRLPPQGSVVARSAGGRWTEVPHSLLPNGGTVSLSSDGSVALSLDSRGRIWRDSAEHWVRHDSVDALRRARTVWMGPGGRSGWAVGYKGVFRWERGRPLSAVLPLDGGEQRIWMNRDGSRGFVYGEDGILGEYRDGRWRRRNPLKAFSDSVSHGSLEAIWMNSEGTEGWAVGGPGVVVRYERGRWRRESLPPEARGFYLKALAMNQGGRRGWAASWDGNLLRLVDGRWTVAHVAPAPPVNRDDVECIATTAEGDTAYMAREQSFWRFAEGKLARLQLPEDTIPHANCLWVDWRSGDLLLWIRQGPVIRYRTEGTHLVQVPGADTLAAGYSQLAMDEGAASGVGILSDGMRVARFPDWRETLPGLSGILVRFDQGPLWAHPEGRQGIVVEGVGVTYAANGQWIRASLPLRNLSGEGGGNGMWVHHSGRFGWVVGNEGSILRMSLARMPAVELQVPAGSSIAELSGDFALRTAGSDSLRLHGIEVGECSRPALSLWDPEYYTVTRSAPGVLRLRFKREVEQALYNHRKQRCSLRFHLRYGGDRDPVSATLLETTFYPAGRPWWHLALAGAAALLLANLLLVLAATRNRWLRGVILSPLGSNLVGLVVGKYLVIEPLVRHVRPIRLAMFRDYRRGLRASPAVERWDGREYIPPAVMVSGQVPDATDERPAWAAVFEHICAAPPGRVWLVEGPSGLGKTALLEQWVSLALDGGRTPLLLRLGSGGTALGEAALALAQYGDVRLDEASVLALLEAGGFVLLLDGLNEDRNPEATRALVRRTSGRNRVVVTGQFDPGWRGDVHMEAVHLSRFGREQLLRLLSAEWADRLLQASHLQDAVGLPQTARLTAHFIQRAGRLPAAQVEVYQDLRAQLPPGGERLSLDEAAWELFRENAILLPTDGRLSAPFLAKAVEAGVVTTMAVDGSQRHRFVHERVHRYFAACYLDSQDGRPLEEWHAELGRRLPRVYWTEVLELWSEVYAVQVQERRAPVSRYEDFLRAVGTFDGTIFRGVYRQADRFAATGVIALSSAFVVDAARLLANGKDAR
jgi:hypothetical protein